VIKRIKKKGSKLGAEALGAMARWPSGKAGTWSGISMPYLLKAVFGRWCGKA